MPLLPNGDYICFECDHERSIPNGQWIRVEDDDTVFTSPPCPECGGQETFCYHDDIPVKTVRQQATLGKIDEDGPEQIVTLVWDEPDHEAWDAVHMLVIADKAQALGVKQKSIEGRMFSDYLEKPKKPKLDEMRDKAKERSKVVRERRRPRTKEDADRELERHKQDVAVEAKARKEHRQREKEEEAKAREKPTDKLTGRPSTAAPTAPEKDSKTPKRVDNGPTPDD